MPRCLLTLLLVLSLAASLTAQDFGARQDLLVGYDGEVFDLVAVDVDLDGDLDIVRLHQYWCTLYRQLGVSTNNFAEPEGLFRVESRSSGDASNTILTGDLNGDGYPDILVDDVYVLSNGQGGYSNAIGDITAGPIRRLSDVDFDGDLDLVRTHNGFASSFRVQYNNGNGRFNRTAAVQLATGGLNLRAGADFNGDGREDFIMSLDGNTELFYRQTSSNTWQRQVLEATACRTASLGDLDGDGDLDILLGLATNEVTWLRNDGALNFSLQPTISTNLENPITTTRLGIGDLDNDGDLDLAIGEQTGDLIGYYNNGTGDFSDRRVIVDGPNAVEYSRNDILDVDGDGLLDILNSGRFPSYNSKLFRQTQPDSFTAVANFSEGFAQPRAIRGVDLNGDGEVELVERYTRWTYRSIQGSVLGTPQLLPGQEASQFVDVTGDGLPEILTFNSEAVVIFRNLGNFQWDAGTALGGLITAGKDIGYGDFDNDGDIDLFAANGSSTLASNAHLIYYENDGNGNFQDFELYDDVQIVLSCRSEDLDNDGLLDIVITRGGASQRLQWYRNDGNRQFLDQGVTSTSVPSNVHMWEYHDVDNDGDFDLVYGQNRTSFQDVGYLERQADGTYVNRLIRRIDANASYGFAYFTMADFDLDGDLDCVVGSGYWTDVYYMQNDGTGTFTQTAVIYNQASFGDLSAVTHADLNDDGAPEPLVYHLLDDRPRLSRFANLMGPAHNVTVRNLELSCDDNGTPSQRDDRLTVSVLASAPNSRIQLSVNPADRFTGDYLVGPVDDTLQLRLGPGSAGGGPVLIAVSDLDDSNLVRTYELPNPSCSTGPPAWDILISEVGCDDQGTPDENVDDKLTHQLGARLYTPEPISKFFVESNAGSFRLPWEPVSNIIEYDFPTLTTYDAARSLYLAGDSVYFILHDLTDTTARYRLDHATPAPCSYSSSVDYIRVECNDNATPADSTDDRIQIEMYVNGPATRAFEIQASPNLIFRGFHQQALDLAGPPGSIYQDTLHVRIAQETYLHVYEYAFPLSGEGCSDLSSGLSGFRQNPLRVHPNPVHDRFFVEGIPTSVHDRTYVLIDATGRSAVHGTLGPDGSATLPASLPAGTYVLKVAGHHTPLSVDR